MARRIKRKYIDQNYGGKGLSAHQLGRIKTACMLALSYREVAQLSGITEERLMKWRLKNESFRKRMDFWMSLGRTKLVKRLNQLALHGSLGALKFYLERRHPDFQHTDEDIDDLPFDPDETYL